MNDEYQDDGDQDGGDQDGLTGAERRALPQVAARLADRLLATPWNTKALKHEVSALLLAGESATRRTAFTSSSKRLSAKLEMCRRRPLGLLK